MTPDSNEGQHVGPRTAATVITEVRARSVEVSWRTWWDFAIVTATGPSGDLVGCGEWSDSGDRSTASQQFDRWAERLAGQSVLAALDLLADAAARIATKTERERWLPLTVIGGLETALCDLSASAAGVSLAEWLGASGQPAPTLLYANINRAVRDRTPEAVARVAEAAVQDGFNAVKIAPFDFLDAGPERAARGLDLARAARDAIGPDIALMLDCHRRLTLPAMLDIAADLAALDLRWLEDAVEMTDVDGLRAVKDAVGAPLAGGEQAADLEQLRPALEAGLLDVVLPDAKHAGGVRRALDLATACAAFGAEVAMHNPSGPIATAASAHAQASVSTGRVLEFAYGEITNRPAVLEPREEIAFGTLRSVARPDAGRGLGHRLADLDAWRADAGSEAGRQTAEPES